MEHACQNLGLCLGILRHKKQEGRQSRHSSTASLLLVQAATLCTAPKDHSLKGQALVM